MNPNTYEFLDMLNNLCSRFSNIWLVKCSVDDIYTDRFVIVTGNDAVHNDDDNEQPHDAHNDDVHNDDDNEQPHDAHSDDDNDEQPHDSHNDDEQTTANSSSPISTLVDSTNQSALIDFLYTVCATALTIMRFNKNEFRKHVKFMLQTLKNISYQ